MQYNTHKLVMTGQLNARGTLFGGQCLSWIDEEAAIFAISVLGTPCIVTKCMSEINFKAPAHCGDIVEIGTSLVSLGNTSITVSCTIRNKTTKQEIVTVEKIVFVHVDENGKSKAHGVVL